MIIFWVLVPCRLVGTCQRFGETCCLHLQGWCWEAWVLIALVMEAASTSETSVNFNQTTRCYNPEDSHLHTKKWQDSRSPDRNLDPGPSEYQAGGVTAPTRRPILESVKKLCCIISLWTSTQGNVLLVPNGTCYCLTLTSVDCCYRVWLVCGVVANPLRFFNSACNTGRQTQTSPWYQQSFYSSSEIGNWFLYQD
jgi:hypothetical protein